MSADRLTRDRHVFGRRRFLQFVIGFGAVMVTGVTPANAFIDNPGGNTPQEGLADISNWPVLPLNRGIHYRFTNPDLDMTPPIEMHELHIIRDMNDPVVAVVALFKQDINVSTQTNTPDEGILGLQRVESMYFKPNASVLNNRLYLPPQRVAEHLLSAENLVERTINHRIDDFTHTVDLLMIPPPDILNVLVFNEGFVNINGSPSPVSYLAGTFESIR